MTAICAISPLTQCPLACSSGRQHKRRLGFGPRAICDAMGSPIARGNPEGWRKPPFWRNVGEDIRIGGGPGRVASSGSGDLVGVVGDIGELDVPTGYVSGHPLSD